MKKYIDAEKLKESLKRRYTDITVPVITSEGGLESYYRRREIRDIIKLIDSLQQEQPAETDEVKWHNDEDYDETDKGRFVLGSVGIGYNGYYIPYTDLLKLPKEERK